MSYRMRVLGLLVIAWLTMSGCQADEPVVSDNGRAALDVAVAAYDSSTASGSADAIVRLFRSDVVVISPQSLEPAVGIEVNRAAWERFFSFPKAEHTITTTDVVMSAGGDIAYTSGRWTATFELPNGTMAPGGGPLVTIWRRDPAAQPPDNEWRIAVAMAHRSE